jgi:hypothetical protein
MITFLQADDDRTQIYASVDGDGPPTLYGPLRLGEIQPTARFAEPATPPARLHRLDDFFDFYGYPSDVVEWVDVTRRGIEELGTTGGRSVSDVATLLAVDPDRLAEAANRESVVDGLYDPEGNPIFLDRFEDNWAAGDLSGLYLNPAA